MFGFGNKKNKQPKQQRSTGIKHGLGFIQEGIRWVVDLDECHGFVIAGDETTDVVRRLVNSFSQAGWPTWMIDETEDGHIPLTKSFSVDHLASNNREAKEMLKRINSDNLMSMLSSGESNAGSLLIIGNLKEPEGTPEDASESIHDNEFANDHYKLALTAIKDIVTDDETFSKVRERLEAVDNIQSKALAAWAVASLQSNATGKHVTLPDDDDLRTSISTLLSQGDSESTPAWAYRMRKDDVLTKAARAFIDIDSRMGLDYEPAGTPRDVATAIRTLDGPYEKEEADDPIWDSIVSISKIAKSTGTRVLVIADGKNVSRMSKLLPSIQVRITAGRMDSGLKWLTGTDDRGRDGIMHIMSPSDYGPLGMGHGTLMSPDMMLDRTQIGMV